jgi:uncharacterized membrane protein (UPF0127 family)
MRSFSKPALLLTGLVAGFSVILILGTVLFWRTDFFRYDAFPTYMELRGERFILETLVTETEREKGLGGRESLCKTCVTLFVFEKPGQYPFWMKDMRFPIDIVWLLGDKVVFIAENVSPDFSGILDPAVIADRVAEFSAGTVRSLEVGEKVIFSH